MRHSIIPAMTQKVLSRSFRFLFTSALASFVFASFVFATGPAKAEGDASPPVPPVPENLTVLPEDAEVTDSGLASKVLVAGDGEGHPGLGALVTVHYAGWTADGELFDSSYERGKPSRLPLNRLIDGWIEGLKLMVPGETRRMWIPEKLAYKGMEDRPAGMLVFDIELIDFLEPPPVPGNVASPPEDAETAKNGLAWKVLKPGHGTEHPKRSSLVAVHYSGWTTDGTMFDSSVMRGEPTSFRLNQVIRGWTQGLMLMVEGEKRRLWIPAKLAYKSDPSKPQGMLVFDVELIEIK